MAKAPKVSDTSRKKIQQIIDTQKNAQLAEGSPSLSLRIDRINRVIALQMPACSVLKTLTGRRLA